MIVVVLSNHLQVHCERCLFRRWLVRLVLLHIFQGLPGGTRNHQEISERGDPGESTVRWLHVQAVVFAPGKGA